MSTISKYARSSCLLLALTAPSFAVAQDADGDGVSDGLDAAPCDARADGVAYAPGLDHSTLMLWEDLWPAVGDTDFNDLVFSVNYAFRMQGAQVSSVRLTLGVLAVGSDYHNGFGLHLPVSRSAVQSVVRTVDGQSPTDLPLDADSELTFVISQDAREFFADQAGAINSVGPAVKAPSVEVEIVFNQPVTLDTALAPFDPFLFRAWDRGHEVHGSAYPGTSSMKASLFGTADDGSAGQRYFVSQGGLPFVLSMPQQAAYPSEFTDVAQLYPDILGFAASGGTSNGDYYLTNVNLAASYANQPAAPAITTAVDRSCLVGQTQQAAGRSCAEIKAQLGGNVVDGQFWIDPDGTNWGAAPIQVWCEMNTDGSAWVVLHHDDYANARQARGTPSGTAGWSLDYISASSALKDARVDAFRIEVEGGPARSFDDIHTYGTNDRPSIDDLFGGTHPDAWYCDSDNADSNCHITTGDGRNWGVWQSTSACCIGSATGGFWYYSQSTQGTENYGICGDGYPNGTGYVGSAHGCNGGSASTPITPTGSKVFKLMVRLTIPLTPDGASCRDILDSGNSVGDGAYVIDPDGPQGRDPVEVWCDMTTDGGGWTVIHDDTHANARNPRGRPSATTGWSVDYLSSTSVLAGLEIEDFNISIPGAWNKTFRDVAGYGSSVRLTPPDLFSASHSDGWQCNSESPGATVCDFTTGDGRNWGLWAATSGCCLGQATGGFWFYSQSTQGTENYGICGDGYPNGTGYNGSGSGCSGGLNYTPITPTGQQRFIVKIRDAARTPTLNSPSAARASCRSILDASESVGSGPYWIAGPNGAPMRAHCDMLTDGGGWTTFFAGRNGSPNVFDHLDAPSFEGICLDESTRCARHIPTTIPMANTDFAIVHGASVVSAPLTEATYGYFTQGTQAGWVSMSGIDLGVGPVNAGPNTFWTGSGTNDGWIAALNQSQSSVFAAHYDYSATWNTGNGQPDTSTVIRLMFREGGRPVQTALNSQSNARSSCRAILDLGESQGSGVYWINSGAGAYEAYCDMVTDGGGWTAFVAGYNGAANTFDHMEAGYHSGICTDAERRCMRRMPASIPQATTEMAVSIGSEMVAMSFTAPLYNWAVSGTQAGWLNVNSVVLTSDVRAQPTSFWTGSGANTSWISARNQASGGSVFAAQYSYNSTWDYGTGTANTWSPVRLFYREGGIPVDPSAHVSCVAALAAGNTTDGVYSIQPLGGRVRQSYCDMSHDGGGWEAIMSGLNGSPNTFDYFDAAYHQGICTDPAAQCQRHLPLAANINSEMAMACGSAMVAFSLNSSVYNFFSQGTQAAWQTLSGVRDIGTSPVTYLPDGLWTGSGSNRAFIIAQASSPARMLGGSYNVNSSWNYCNSVPDTSSVLRVFFR